MSFFQKNTFQKLFLNNQVTSIITLVLLTSQCDQKKSPNVYKSCPKMVSLEKWIVLTPLQKLPKNGGDWGKFSDAKGFKKLPKIQ